MIGLDTRFISSVAVEAQYASLDCVERGTALVYCYGNVPYLARYRSTLPGSCGSSSHVEMHAEEAPALQTRAGRAVVNVFHLPVAPPSYRPSS